MARCSRQGFFSSRVARLVGFIEHLARAAVTERLVQPVVVVEFEVGGDALADLSDSNLCTLGQKCLGITLTCKIAKL